MSPKRLDAIVFDMDATLVDLGGFVDWRKAHEEIVEAYLRYDCDPSVVQECSAKGLFNMLELMYEQLQEERGPDEAYKLQESVYEILGDYEATGANSCTLMDGCIDVLDWLKEENIPLGICTSNSPKSAETALRLQGIREYFSVVVGRTVDQPMKPHPAQLEICFKELGANPKNSMMVGDSHKDIIAGKSLGAYTVGIPVYFT
ncbi:MAG: HAD family hydrolase, partial [Candidatus Bathyarchaeota archaeon]|nr:HAD family hydrolase [Candidatus Bathyarchaeota archaeon]